MCWLYLSVLPRTDKLLHIYQHTNYLPFINNIVRICSLRAQTISQREGRENGTFDQTTDSFLRWHICGLGCFTFSFGCYMMETVKDLVLCLSALSRHIYWFLCVTWVNRHSETNCYPLKNGLRNLPSELFPTSYCRCHVPAALSYCRVIKRYINIFLNYQMNKRRSDGLYSIFWVQYRTFLGNDLLLYQQFSLWPLGWLPWLVLRMRQKLLQASPENLSSYLIDPNFLRTSVLEPVIGKAVELW